jgi:hypothetical protein
MMTIAIQFVAEQRRATALAIAALVACSAWSGALVLAQAAPCLPVDAGQAMTSTAQTSPFFVALKPGPIKVGSPFNVAVTVCSPSGTPIERVVIDATMPAHRHGMNYKPDVVSLGAGKYEARNLVFHMPGTWQFAVAVYADGKPTHLTLGVDAK